MESRVYLVIMEYKDTPGLKKLIREFRSEARHGEGGRAYADQVEKCIREGYEQRLKEEQKLTTQHERSLTSE